MQVASRSWEKATNSPLQPPKDPVPPTLAQCDSFWTSDLQKCSITTVVLSDYVCINYYSSYRKLIQEQTQ